MRSLVLKLCHCVDLLIHVVCTYDFVSVIDVHARSAFLLSMLSKLVLLFAFATLTV